ncbi:MAG: DUF1631 domain-containing protein [Rubrivivax sp.]|nr:DUF1631 domain-containing protein [Rubrivivax sp.]
MTSSAALQSFVEDELKRMPALAQKVMDDTLMALSNMPMTSEAAERFKAVDLTMTLRPQRQRVAAAFVESLQEQVRRLMSGDRSALRDQASGAGPGAGPRGLQLMDEGKVASEVLIAKCIDQIKGAAEFEFRELTAFVCALVGDMQVSSDHNPFRPDVMAHALWVGAQCLPEDGGLRSLFMKMASGPLAQELRQEVAAACGRLEDAGVQPAMYSTVIVPSGAKVPDKPSASNADTSAAASSTAFESGTKPADLPADPDYLGLLSRLFDVILADRRLAADVKFAISRLQAPALKLAQVDDTLLDTHDHVLWLLLDRMAWQAEVLPEAPHPVRSAVMQAISNLINQLTAGSAQDAGAYQWTLNSLMTSERQRFDQRRQRLASVINELEALALQSTQPTELAGTTIQAVDSGHMDTVPSQLLDMPSAPESRTADKRWMVSLRPGHVARIYLSGQWVNAQLVWVDPRQDVFLWADCRSDAVRPIKRQALALLQSESLAMAHEPRCLVRAAARMVAVQISRNRPA